MQSFPLIEEYSKKLQREPESRIFAPLAEAYRKAGMPEEAVDVARAGLKIHPQFIGGKVALSRALFDLKKYSEVVSELEFIIDDVPDNLAAQKLLAESFLFLGNKKASLMHYKMLLFYLPKDAGLGRIVSELETQGYSEGKTILEIDLREVEVPESEVNPIDSGRSLTARKKMDFLMKLLKGIERYRGAQV